MVLLELEQQVRVITQQIMVTHSLKLLTLISNLVDNAYIEYDLSKVIEARSSAGNCLVDQTYGNIANEKDLATFSVTLRNCFSAMTEQVVSETTGLTGVVRDWIDISETLTVLSKDDFKVGEVIRGVVSRVSLVHSLNKQQMTSRDHYWFWNYRYSRLGQSVSGVLNNDFQKLPNNEYYQNFSYSLKSQVLMTLGTIL